MSLKYRAAVEAAGWKPGDDPREFVDPVEFTRAVWFEEDYLNSPVKVSEEPMSNVNRIVQLFDVEGVLRASVGAPVEPLVDVSNFPTDYADAIGRVRAADAAFAALPAKIREAFRNDPDELLKAISDPSRRAQLEELGVVEKKAGGAATPPPAATQ